MKNAANKKPPNRKLQPIFFLLFSITTAALFTSINEPLLSPTRYYLPKCPLYHQTHPPDDSAPTAFHTLNLAHNATDEVLVSKPSSTSNNSQALLTPITP